MRELGYECFPYIDDSFLVADLEQEVEIATCTLCQNVENLGFYVNWEKSVLTPTQELLFLGFLRSSVQMTVRPSGEKIEKFEKVAIATIQKPVPTVREVARLVGLMVAYSPGVEYGAAHIKGLERDKNLALAVNRGNYEGPAWISKRGLEEIQWWRDTLPRAEKKIILGAPDIQIKTDASGYGWELLDRE